MAHLLEAHYRARKFFMYVGVFFPYTKFKILT